MAGYKFTMIFQYVSGQGNPGDLALKGGWSESYYSSTAGEAKIESFKILSQLRANLLPLRSYVSGIRIQPVDPSGPAQLFSVNYPGNGAAVVKASDIPQMAVLLRFRGLGVLNTRTQRIAAIPDPQVTYGEYKPTMNYRIVMSSFLLALNEWQFRAADLTQPKREIVSVSTAGVVTTIGNHGLVLGDKVKIFSTLDTDGSPHTGLFTVDLAIEATQFRVKNWPHGACTEGQCQKYVIIYPGILVDETNISRVVTRKIGRPSLGYRGRRSKART